MTDQIPAPPLQPPLPPQANQPPRPPKRPSNPPAPPVVDKYGLQQYVPPSFEPVNKPQTQAVVNTMPENPRDTGSLGWAVLGFFIPIVGLVLWLVWRDEQPKNADKAGKGALASIIVNMILFFLYCVALFLYLWWASKNQIHTGGILA